MSTPHDPNEEHADETKQVRIAQDETVSTQRKGSGPGRNLAVIVAVLAVFAIGVVLFALFWLRPTKQVTTETPAAAANAGTVKFLMEQQWLIRMKLALVEEQTVARQITATGRVIPSANSQAIVAPPVSGIISGRNLPRVGQRVAQGQTIAIIQQTATSAEQAQVRAAAASLNLEKARLDADRRTASGEVEASRIRLDLATKEAARAQRLYERKAFSERHMQAAEADLKAAKAAYDAAVKRLEALTSSPAVANARSGVGSANASYTVRAPVSGYVTKVNKSLGEQVQPGEAIVEISNLDTVWVEAPIFERDLSRLGGNVSATFTTPAYPDQEFKGVVLDIGAVVDEQTRASKVIFQLPNSGRALRLGMQANVRLDAGEQVAAMMIPKEAVLEHEGKKIVYVLLSGEEFERREVIIGDEMGNNVAVLSGLNKGERVVTQGAYQLKLQELQPADAGAHTHET